MGCYRRYPEDVLENIKRTVDLPGLYRAQGIVLEPNGKGGYVCLCPFHNETTPSHHLNPLNGIWGFHCFGCGKAGTCFHFVMWTRGVSFTHAVEILGNGYSHLLQPTDRIVKKTTVPLLPSPVALTAADHEVLKQVLRYYHERLKLNPSALAYLQRRKIDGEETITHHLIGFCDRTLGLRLPDNSRKEGAELRDRLKRVGIYKDNGREHFRGCLVIPVMDANGVVTEVYGRRVGTPSAGLSSHLYLPGPHRGFINPQALQSEELIICEAFFDYLSFWNFGFRNVTSAYGTGGLTEELFQAIVAAPAKVLKFAFDHDESGDSNAVKYAERFLKTGKDCYRIVFPVKDANEFVQQVSDPRPALQRLINSAVWLGQGEKPVTVVPVDIVREPAVPPEPRPVCPAAVDVTEPVALTEPGQEPDRQAETSDRVSEAVRETDHQPETQGKPVVEAQVSREKVDIVFDNRQYRMYGLGKNMTYGVLKVNLRVTVDELFYDEEVNLLKARSKEAFINAASREVGVSDADLRQDICRIVLKMEELQDAQIKKAMEPKKKTVTLSEKEIAEAMALLKSPHLLDRIAADYEKCGLVGEKTNSKVQYLACTSRLLEKPLNIIIQSSSGAGKSYLMEATLSFMPPEAVVKYSAVTGQALFYVGETELKNKILAIEEKEGAERASYALKLLMSEGELVIKSTGKNPITGRHEAHEYRVEGPVSLVVPTTALEVDEEVQNRTVILTPDESRAQTQAIQKLQRWLRTQEGHWARDDWDHIRTVHRNAQRLLRPLEVYNPYACSLTFIDDKTRTRRDQLKYLTMIDALASLHQYQRPVRIDLRKGTRVEFVEVTLDDIEAVNHLANEVLGRSLDELPPHTRRFLMDLETLVLKACREQGKTRSEYRFTRRFICDSTSWSYNQVHVHMERLVALEYVLMHHGSRGQQCVYELLYDGRGKTGELFMIGLIDVDAFRKQSNQNKDMKKDIPMK